MSFNGGTIPFSVIYNDGETEINLGFLNVDPTTNFKTVLSIISKKIRISSQHFYVLIGHSNTDRKIPLTDLNLVTMYRNGGSYYFYVKKLKRYKKSPTKNKNLSEKLMFLRRDGVVDGKIVNGSRIDYAPSIVDMERRMWELQIERAAFLRSTENNCGGGSGGGRGGAGCSVCLTVNLNVIETVADFHLCPRDEVIVGFRSSAGPISRPAKDSGGNGY